MLETDLRKRLGARLLVERIQVRNWNELRAATEAKLQPKTIRRIERGMNYEIASLEKYARALGRPLEAWLRELLLQETQRPADSAPGAAGEPFPNVESIDPPARDKKQRRR